MATRQIARCLRKRKIFDEILKEKGYGSLNEFLIACDDDKMPYKDVQKTLEELTNMSVSLTGVRKWTVKALLEFIEQEEKMAAAS